MTPAGLASTTLKSLHPQGLPDRVARRYRERVDSSKIIARSVWRAGMPTAEDLVTQSPVQG